MSLSLLAILLGLGFGLPHLMGVLNPKKFGDCLRQFPRSNQWGYVLMGLATVWFLYNLQQEEISDFAAYKKLMVFGFGAVGIGACLYVRDFLAIRGLAILFLLLAKLMVDSARWSDSGWRLVIVVWAYVWVFAGMWFTISPWRLRDMIFWMTDNEQRIRFTSGLRLAFGLFVALLGMFAL